MEGSIAMHSDSPRSVWQSWPADAESRIMVLDDLAEADAQAEKRSYPRYRFRSKTWLYVLLHHLNGSKSASRVMPCDLSAGGLGFYHLGPIGLHTRCVIKLPTLGGDPDLVEGTVVRCRYLCNRFHRIGVSFTDPIELGRFISLSAVPA